MKKIMLFAFLLLLTLSAVSAAIEIPNYYDKYVNDFTGMFNANEVSDLRNLLYGLDMNTTAEVVVATIKDCSGDYNGYAYNLASTWKIGKADKDNGLLILYCQTQGKLTVQTGYGLEGILPDSKIGRYLDDYYVPLRYENKTDAGIIAFTEQMAQIIEDNKAEVISGQAGGSSSGSSLMVEIIFVIVFALIVIFLIRFFRGKNLEKQKGKIIKKKVSPFATVLDAATYILLFMVIGIGFNLFLIVILIAVIIIRAIIGGPSNRIGFFGGGFGGGGGFSGGGFGGGGFGGGGFGGGGASR